MKGSILGFDKVAGTGAINSENDERFTFNLADWKSEVEPKPGQAVDFVVTDGQAQEVYALGTTGIGSGARDAAGAVLKSGSAIDIQGFVGKLKGSLQLSGVTISLLGWVLAGHIFGLFTVIAIWSDINETSATNSFFGNASGIPIVSKLGAAVMLYFYYVGFRLANLLYKLLNETATRKDKRSAVRNSIFSPFVVPVIAFILIVLGFNQTQQNALLGGVVTSEAAFPNLLDFDIGFILMVIGGLVMFVGNRKEKKAEKLADAESQESSG